MEGGVRLEWPSERSLRDGWLLVVAILLAIQFIFAAATAVSHQLADSNSADLIEIARECSEAKECATKGGAGRLGLFSGASWERLVAFSLRRGGLGQLQFIQLGMLIVSMAITFVILRRYLGTRTAVVSLGVYLPLVFCGFSFGAAVGLRAAAGDDRVVGLIGLGTPVTPVDDRAYDLGFLQTCTQPKLFCSGDRDQFGPRAKLEAFLAALPEPKQLTLIAGADHFFEGRLSEMRAVIEAWVRAKILSEPAV